MVYAAPLHSQSRLSDGSVPSSDSDQRSEVMLMLALMASQSYIRSSVWKKPIPPTGFDQNSWPNAERERNQGVVPEGLCCGRGGNVVQEVDRGRSGYARRMFLHWFVFLYILPSDGCNGIAILRALFCSFGPMIKLRKAKYQSGAPTY